MLEPKPPVEEVAEKAPAEMVEPEWIGVMPPPGEVVRLLDEVETRRPPGAVSEAPRWGWRWPVEDWGAPMPARAWAAWIREEEAGASGVFKFEWERWWRPWRGIVGGVGGIKEGGTLWGGGLLEGGSEALVTRHSLG